MMDKTIKQFTTNYDNVFGICMLRGLWEIGLRVPSLISFDNVGESRKKYLHRYIPVNLMSFPHDTDHKQTTNHTFNPGSVGTASS